MAMQPFDLGNFKIDVDNIAGEALKGATDATTSTDKDDPFYGVDVPDFGSADGIEFEDDLHQKPTDAETQSETLSAEDEELDLKAQVKMLKAELESARQGTSEVLKWKKDTETNAYSMVLREKEAERIQALKDHDIDRMLQLEGEITQIKDAAAKASGSVTTNNTEQVKAQVINGFVERNRTRLDTALTKIHSYNFADVSKVSESKQRTMLAVLNDVVREGVPNGMSVDEIVKEYADRLNLRTGKPVPKTGATTSAKPTAQTAKGSLQQRFNALPADVRSAWQRGDLRRVWGGKLEDFITDYEK